MPSVVCTCWEPELIWNDGIPKYMDILYSQEAMYHPEWVTLDEPLPTAAKALQQLREHNYEIHLVTARPHWMQLATEAWLQQHGMIYDVLICKNFASRERYTRTALWKAEAVLAREATSSVVLYVDADTRSLEAVERLTPAHILTRASLVPLDLQTIELMKSTSSTLPFVVRKDRVDYALINIRTRHIERRFREETTAMRFCDLWNFVMGPPYHCGCCGCEVGEEEHTYGHSHYLALCFSCSCAHEGD